MHVEYTGVVTSSAMAVIGPQVVRTAKTDSAIFYWHKAVTLWPDIQIRKDGICLAGKGILVVRPDQHLDAVQHCLILAKINVLRTVFLEQEISLALLIAESHARLEESTRLQERIAPL